MKIDGEDLLLCIFAIGGFWKNNWTPFTMMLMLLVVSAFLRKT